MQYLYSGLWRHKDKCTVSILREQSSQDRPGKRAVGTNQRAGKKDVVKACPLMPADH